VGKRAIIVGAGITGATAAAELAAHDWDVTVYESEDEVGGNLRTAELNGIRYERFGPHIWHTDSKPLHTRASPYLREYIHRVKTWTGIGPLSWPPQLGEIQEAAGSRWPKIERELRDRPELPSPSGSTFEDYAIALMGQTLYELFIKHYTIKQWGRDPRTLSAAFAPKRIDFRTDGDTRLFRDQPQGWFDGEAYISDMLRDVTVQLGRHVTLEGIDSTADAYVVTAPLDDFVLGHGARMLAWRGVGFEYSYTPGVNLQFPTAVTNFPVEAAKVRFTRVTEAKHLTGSDRSGTVLAWEYSGTDDRFYPVLDTDGVNATQQRWLRDELKKELPTAVLAGRLATYAYIDMDQAMQQGLNAARKILDAD
jgi:UDP-galactopyranose mutase